MIADFDALIHPITRAEFVANFVSKTPLHIRSSDPGRAKYLLTPTHINDIISSGLLWPDRFQVKLNGANIPENFYTTKSRSSPINPVNLAKIVRQGASIILQEMGTVIAEIGDIEQIIQRELLVSGWTNAYLSFSKGGALSLHYDPHDVLVIQVEGRKRWRLYGQTEQSPVRPMRLTEPGPADVVEEYVLDPGDLLFVPRGVWHQAELEAPASIHLTFALEGFTGVELVKTLTVQSELEEVFRRYAPRTANDAALRDWEQHIKARMHELVDGVSLSAVLAKGDGETRARPVSRLCPSPDLADGTILRTALRRRLHDDQWRESEGATIGGSVCSLTQTARLALQAIDDRTVTSFGAIATVLEAEGLDRDTSARVVAELADHGLVIVQNLGAEANPLGSAPADVP